MLSAGLERTQSAEHLLCSRRCILSALSSIDSAKSRISGQGQSPRLCGEDAEYRGTLQQGILLGDHLEAMLLQETPDLVKGAGLVLNLNCDLADHRPMLASYPRQNFPFTSLGIDLQQVDPLDAFLVNNF
jgi:hypothetical protein